MFVYASEVACDLVGQLLQHGGGECLALVVAFVPKVSISHELDDVPLSGAVRGGEQLELRKREKRLRGRPNQVRASCRSFRLQLQQ